jgi:5-methylthioadenosine/S-adenosylhomocysteine deaminase
MKWAARQGNGAVTVVSSGEHDFRGGLVNTVIRNATIVTGDSGRSVLYDAAIAVQDDRIAAIGPWDEIASEFTDAEQIDGRGKAVFPGLVNAHTHLLAVVDRGILEDFGFPTRLRFPEAVRGMLTPEEKNVIGLLGAIEAIRSETTCMLEISNNLPDYAGSLQSTGLRLILAENINDIDDAKLRDGKFEFVENKREAGLQRSVDLIENWHGKEDGRVTCFVSPHAPELCSPELLRASREMAEQYGIGYTIHLSQSHQEIEGVMRVRGVSPTHYLFANELLGPRLVAAHCRYVNPSEIALLGQTGTSVSNNPAIAARRGAAAPVKELLEDMVEVMRTGLFAERVRRNDEMYPWPEDVLEWTTRGGARALGIDEQVGTLEVGKKADLFIVDTMRAHLVPNHRIVSAFVHQGHPSDVTSVMVNGSWLMRDSKVLTVDEQDIIRRADQIGRAAWHRLAEKYPNVPFPITLSPMPG